MNIKELNETLTQLLENEEKLEIILHASLSEEENAIAAYEKRAAKCKEHNNEQMAKMFQELADDEKVHAAQLRKALELLGLNNQEKEQEDTEEATELLGEE